MFGLPEELGQLVILLGFILPPIVAILKGWLKLDKKAASIVVIVLCLVFAALGAILLGKISLDEAIVSILWQVLEVSVWVLVVAFGLYKIFYQALGLDDWIVHKAGGNNT